MYTLPEEEYARRKIPKSPTVFHRITNHVVAFACILVSSHIHLFLSTLIKCSYSYFTLQGTVYRVWVSLQLFRMHDNVIRGKSGRIAPYVIGITFDVTTKCFG